jgi:hypothetical protein
MTATTTTTDHDLQALADQLVDFLETGAVADGLFDPALFLDFTMPLWRLQADTSDGAVAIRRTGHPQPGRVAVRRLDPLPRGFLIEVEEFWEADGESWYCRELMRADVADGSIVDLAVYCTGDWDSARVAQHAATVRLVRP